MYLVVIMAFAFVLSDDLPPRVLNLLGGPPWTAGPALYGTLAVIFGQIAVMAAAAAVARRITIARLSGEAAYERAAGAYSTFQSVFIGMLAAALIGTMILTPWAPMVRDGIRLGGLPLHRIPLACDLFLLLPFFAALLTVWTIFRGVESRIRAAAPPPPDNELRPSDPPGSDETRVALAAATRRSSSAGDSLAPYLLDKLRHQVAIVAVPMLLIALAKYFTDLSEDSLYRATRIPWASDVILGVFSACTLGFAPVMLRYVWTTEPLPAGRLRDRFARTCGRIGLRYREILLWHTHGSAINAAVMGFVAPLRYILVSDALLETMDAEEVEAVFGHEAGHVRHWHLPYFGLFALISMYVSGGVVVLLGFLRFFSDPANAGLLQLIGLAVLLLCWLFGFGWLSRRFERQADVYAVRCLTPDVRSCLDRCPVHGEIKTPGLCLTAANLFGRTLLRIADLNGIPREAPSWRHGSIESRCRLIADLADDPRNLRKFDRSLLAVKIGLFVAGLVGTAAAALLYGQQILDALC
jgi:Zn-dependent protease with chaperone function